MANRILTHLVLAAASCSWLIASLDACAANSLVIPKWERLELTFKSRREYTNALQEAEMRVLFVSPLGETNRTYGFWDGGKTWRVRFAPSFPGRWTYFTMCSDTANAGLHEQSGEFLCAAAEGKSRFGLHGPIRVARDQVHFEHADRTPFLWLGDAAWDAAPRSSLADWDAYVASRAAQNFNVVQWRLTSADAAQSAGAFSGREWITVNPGVFRQLDAKVEALTRAGLLAAIAPLWEIGGNPERTLPEAQAIALLRYAVARWGANPVAWILAFESESNGSQATRWQRIGRAVFNPVLHGPVIILPGEAPWVLPGFRTESWVDALGFQTTQFKDEDALPWLLQGPLSLERNNRPARPLIALSPAPELASTANGANGFAPNFIRRGLWCNLLMNTPAGVSYAAEDIASWRVTDRHTIEQPWRAALAWPGAAAIGPLADAFSSVEFWRLQPAAREFAPASDGPALRNRVVAGMNAAGDVVVVYVPESRTVKFLSGVLPKNAILDWFDPRTGASRPAGSGVAGPTGWEFTPPSQGDWVLLIHPPK